MTTLKVSNAAQDMRCIVAMDKPTSDEVMSWGRLMVDDKRLMVDDCMRF